MYVCIFIDFPEGYSASVPFIHLIFYILSLSSRIYNLLSFLHLL